MGTANLNELESSTSVFKRSKVKTFGSKQVISLQPLFLLFTKIRPLICSCSIENKIIEIFEIN